MQFLSGLVGKNPKISFYHNAWCKTKSLAIVKTKGSLGTFKVDCVKLALSALAFLVACLVAAPLNLILVGVGSICLYKSFKRYAAGPHGEAEAEGTQAIRTARTTAQNVVNTVQETLT